MRIRTVKPDFFLHEDLAALSPLHRIVFIGLWCAADRAGRFEWRPNRLKVQIVPYDRCDFDKILSELVESGFVTRYVVNGAEYGAIPSWERHQWVNHREAVSIIPHPDEGEPFLGTPRHAEENLGNPRTIMEYRKGKEGKGKDKDACGLSPVTPLLSSSPDFLSAWAEWEQHRREIKHPLTPTAAKQQIARLDAMGPERATAAIRNSIANGWRGLFEPKDGPGPQTTTKPESVWELNTRLTAIKERLVQLRSKSPGEHCDLMAFLSEDERAELGALVKAKKEIESKLRT